MKLPRDVNAEDLCKALARLGYVVSRQTGSHIRLVCSNPAHAITVPNHRPVRVGTLAAIILEISRIRGIEKQRIASALFD